MIAALVKRRAWASSLLASSRRVLADAGLALYGKAHQPPAFRIQPTIRRGHLQPTAHHEAVTRLA